MARTKQNARKSTGGPAPRKILAQRKPMIPIEPIESRSPSPSSLPEVDLDSITIIEEITINGQKHNIF